MKTINKFTNPFVKNIKPSDKRVEYTEGNGFVLRVNPSGTKSWVYYFKFDGKPFRFTFGRYPSLNVAEARKMMADAAELKDKGINPIADKASKEKSALKAKQRNRLTIKFIANEFYDEYIAKNRKSPKNVKQIVDAEIISSLGDIKLHQITTRDIVLAVQKISARGANSHANKTLAIIKQMFSYAISVGLTETNPAQNIKAKIIGGEEKARERFLTLSEIKTIWLWLDNTSLHKMHPATVIALKILLLTGVRSGELRLSEWDEVNFSKSLWTIPASHTKTGIIQRVHLAPVTIEYFRKLKKLSSCRFVLPSTRTNKPWSDKALARAVKRTSGKIKGIEHWTPHDLRRTFSTQVSALGVSTGIVEKCLGHKLPKIMATYNKHEYLPERKEALELWAEKIELLIQDNNVVMLDSKAS